MDVFDASVALKWVLPEPGADQARRLRDEFRNSLRDLIAPDAFATECAHALLRSERRGLIRDAPILWRRLMSDSPRLFPSLPLMPRALEIASRFRVGVYDCLYVALAEREGCELITADVRLVNGLGPAFPFVRALATYP